MKNFHGIGSLFLILALLFFLVSPQVFAVEEWIPEAEEEASQEDWDTKESEEGYRAVLPNAFNPSIHHRRPTRTKWEHFGFGVYSDILSRYVWRGLLSSRGWVWQPSLSVEYYGVGFNAWANFPMSAQPNQGQFNEIDLTLYYNHNFKKINFHTWFILDIYPNGNPTSLDFGTTSLEWDLHVSGPVGPIVLFTDFAIRIVSARGSVYWDMGIGHRQKLPLNFAIESSVLFALANGIFTRAHIAPGVGTVPYLFEFSLAFPWNPIGGFKVTPRMYVSTILDGGARAAVTNPTLIWGGVSLSYELGELR